MHGATCSELLSARAVIDVGGRIISKVAAREGAIISLRLVDNRNMRCDVFLLDQPVQHRSRPVSGIPDKPSVAKPKLRAMRSTPCSVSSSRRAGRLPAGTLRLLWPECGRLCLVASSEVSRTHADVFGEQIDM